MKAKRWLLLLALVALPVAGCSKGEECDPCDSDDDCKGEFVCSTFDDGSRRCGSGLGATTCRIPR